VNAADRFFEKVTPDGNGCLLFRTRSTEGYGRFADQGKLWQAHRWLLQRAMPEPIPAHMDVDHLCGNRACVRPSHLEIVTRSENIRRGTAPATNRARAAAITHCPKGHPYDEENTYRYTRRGMTVRMCRECMRERNRARYAAGYMRDYRAGRRVDFSVEVFVGDPNPVVFIADRLAS
jgi:hypothetical protein